MRLYSSAIDKCDQVLEIKPSDASVLVTFGLALKDMALCMTLDDPDVQLHLAVSTQYNFPMDWLIAKYVVSVLSKQAAAEMCSMSLSSRLPQPGIGSIDKCTARH